MQYVDRVTRCRIRAEVEHRRQRARQVVADLLGIDEAAIRPVVRALHALQPRTHRPGAQRQPGMGLRHEDDGDQRRDTDESTRDSRASARSPWRHAKVLPDAAPNPCILLRPRPTLKGALDAARHRSHGNERRRAGATSLGAGRPVRALVRNAAKAETLRGLSGVEIVEGDLLRPETLYGPLTGVAKAVLISSSAPDMVEVQSSFIEAAKRAGVKHIVKLSGIMPDLDSPFRFARMHGEIEKRLAACGVAFTNLRAGEFMHAYFRQVPSIVGQGAIFLPMADAKIASIDVGDIAEMAIAVLLGSGHEGQTYPLTGPEALSMAEVAERLSAATGKAIRYVDVPPDKAREAQLARGVPPFLADALAELFAERRKGKESNVSPVIREKFGLEPTSFAEFARRNAAIFRGEQPAPRV